ncbi:MAG TPA: hypothetical protein VFZ25_08260 [Chloroflexota bacterium]|nr:hypothetical protein [Chloroflexota bacterium]
MTSDPLGAPPESRPLPHVLELGTASGIAAGLVYLIAASVITRLVGGPLSSPLRLPAAVVFGPAALGGYFPVWRAIFAGVGTDLALSAFLGVAWVIILGRLGWLGAGPIKLAPFGAAYGLLIWLVGDVLLGALAFPQVAVADLLWGGLVAHALFFGGALAAAVLLLRSNERDSPP